MTISQEFTKLKNVKSRVRKAIQTKSDLQLQDIFSTYPSFIQGITSSFNDADLITYCEDTATTFTVTYDSIRDYAFYKWTNLQYLVLDNDNLINLEGTHAFEGTNLKGIYVPSALVSTYKDAQYWNTYSQIITTGTPPTVPSTVIIEHLQNAGRTIEELESLTLEQLITDYRL